MKEQTHHCLTGGWIRRWWTILTSPLSSSGKVSSERKTLLLGASCSKVEFETQHYYPKIPHSSLSLSSTHLLHAGPPMRGRRLVSKSVRQVGRAEWGRCLFIYLRENVTICYVTRWWVVISSCVCMWLLVIKLLLFLMECGREEFYNLITMMRINFICFQLTHFWADDWEWMNRK